MTNFLLQLKLKERLNKLDSMDFANIEPYQIVEAFNKAQLEFVSRAINKAELNKEIIDSVCGTLITSKKLIITNKSYYYESDKLPDNYLSYASVSLTGEKEICSNKRNFITYLVENPDIEHILRNSDIKPSWEWGETVVTLFSNKVRIYTNNEFTIERAILNYYRTPQNIQIVGAAIPPTGIISTVDIPCEFRDNVVEKIIDECAAILAGDMGDFNQMQRNLQNANRQ